MELSLIDEFRLFATQVILGNGTCRSQRPPFDACTGLDERIKQRPMQTFQPTLRLIPNARLAIFAGSDHFVLFTNPEKVLATLTPFLAEPETGR